MMNWIINLYGSSLISNDLKSASVQNQQESRSDNVTVSQLIFFAGCYIWWRRYVEPSEPNIIILKRTCGLDESCWKTHTHALSTTLKATNIHPPSTIHLLSPRLGNVKPAASRLACLYINIHVSVHHIWKCEEYKTKPISVIRQNSVTPICLSKLLWCRATPSTQRPINIRKHLKTTEVSLLWKDATRVNRGEEVSLFPQLTHMRPCWAPSFSPYGFNGIYVGQAPISQILLATLYHWSQI